MDFLPYRLEKMTPAIVRKAREELGETDEVRARCLAQVRKYIKEQKNLTCTDDDIFLLAFLRKAKFDMKKVTKLLQAYFKEKKNFPEIFLTPNYQGLKKCFESNLASIMPRRDADGCAVIIFRADKWNVNEFKFVNCVHFMAVSILAAVEYEPSQVCGIKIILSAKGLTLSHLMHIQFRYLVLLARGVRSCLPIRIKGIHFVNENSHLEFLWNLISFTAGPKIRSRVHFHGSDYESLHELIPAAILPQDLGGQFTYDPAFCIEEIELQKEVYFKRLLHNGYR